MLTATKSTFSSWCILDVTLHCSEYAQNIRVLSWRLSNPTITLN